MPSISTRNFLTDGLPGKRVRKSFWTALTKGNQKRKILVVYIVHPLISKSLINI